MIRSGLPGAATPRVSSSASGGERGWPSRQMLGLLDPEPRRGIAFNSQEALQ